MDNNTQNITKFDDISYWLDLPQDHKDYQNKPKPASKCTSNCVDKFERIFTKRLIRIASLSDYIGIDNFDYHDMCGKCKRGVYNWFFDDVWADHPEYKTTFEIFEAWIEENNASSTMDSAYRQYQKMAEDYHNDNVNGITKMELEGYRKYFKDCEKSWNESRGKMNEKLKEYDAINRGYQID